METEYRRGNVKTSKKGGKRAKALTAEEEAKRREVLKEKLREKLELEKRALKVVERLLEDSVAEDFLIDCARLITPSNYKDAIEERFIAKLCGYPLCPNKLGKIPTQKYKISTKTNKVYDITERKCFCSNFCYKASKDFELQISSTPLWLRQHESPKEIRLMKKGDGGSSGEEVMLSERRLQEKDIEDPLATQPEDLRSSAPRSSADDRSDSSDVEQEQDFVSSVVSQRRGPRVHWGDLPKHKDSEGEPVMVARQKSESSGDEEEVGGRRSVDTEWEVKLRENENRRESHSCQTGSDADAEKPERLHSDTPNRQQVSEEVSEEPAVEEAMSKLNLCSLPETPAAPLPAESAPPLAVPLTSPPCTDSAESKPLPSATPINMNQDGHMTALTNLHITQVGMSKRGAAGLRDLVKKHAAGAEPGSVRLNLLECLRRTLKDWCTEATLTFLYGTGHSPGLSPDVGEEKEEELDEDDLADEVTAEDAQGIDAGLPNRASAPAPDLETLREETQQLELRVKGFYKGTWVLPEKGEEAPGGTVTVEDQSTKEPRLPLVDSHAQHLIQKRITVERLTSCLRNMVGPLRLTMSDISTDLNNLVRTFKFTNTNIIHKTPQWTLIAVVLLHLLSEVSPVVREALAMVSSVKYLSTLMEGLGLRDQDLLDLVRAFKTRTHGQTETWR